MDKLLLASLDNLSVALTTIADILNKKQTKSATGAALESGDFSKDIKQISVGIKSIKADTEKILKSQNAILELSKKKSSEKKTPMEETGGDKKKESNLKKGVGTIILIAVAVLAIGMAFKLVGKIDFLSVIGLGLAIVIIAVAFEKVARLNLTIKQAAIASLAMVMMSVAVMLSSWALGMIRPIGLAQAITGILIAGLFTVLAFGLPKIVKALEMVKNPVKIGFLVIVMLPALAFGIAMASWALSMIKPIGFAQAITGILIAGLFTVLAFGLPKIVKALEMVKNPVKIGFLVIVMLPALAFAIAMSSWALSMIKPIGFGQAITGILIAGMFAVLAFGLPKIVKALNKVQNPVAMAFLIPLILPVMAAAIAASSYVLQFVKPIGFAQAITAILIAALFVVLSFGLVKIVKAISKMEWKDVAKMPVFFTLIAAAIAASAFIFAKAAPYFGEITFMMMLKVIILGVTMGIVLIIVAFAMKMMGKISWGDVIKVPVLFTLLALAIAASAFIISKASGYIDSISFMTMLKLVIFSICMAIAVVVTAIAMKIVNLLGGVMDYIKGGIAVIIIAATIMVASKILNYGDYKKYPDWKWSLGVGMSLIAFGLAAVVLGSIAMSGLGALAILAGCVMILAIAATVVATSHILNKGKYDKFPPVLWALGTTAVMLPFGVAAVALGLISITGIGAIAIVAGLVAILLIAKTIVKTSEILSGGKYTGGPPIWWAISTGLVMTGFGLAVLTLGSFIVGTLGLGYIALKAGSEAVSIIAQSIVNASVILQNGKYVGGPTKEWAEGISIALGAFSPVYGMMMASGILKLFGGGGVSPADFAAAIVTVSNGIMTSAGIFADPKNNKTGTWVGGPSKAWAEGVGTAIGAFAPVFKVLQDSSPGLFSKGGPSVESMSKAIMTISRGIVDAARYFSDPEISKLFNTEGKYPSKNWGEGVGAALNAFAPVFKSMSEGSGWFTSGDDVINGMVRAVSHISRALVNSARAFFGIKAEAWGVYPTTAWASGVGAAVESFVGIVEKVKDVSPVDSLKVSIVISQIAGAARLLFSSKQFFGFKLDSSWVKSLSSNVIPFATLAKEVDKLLGYDEKLSIKSGGFLGFGQTTTTTTVRKMKDVSIINRIISQMSDSARLLWSNKKFFEFKLDAIWVKNLSISVLGYAKLVSQIDKLLGPEVKKTVSSGAFSVTTTTVKKMKDVSIVNKIVSQMVDSARLLWNGKKFFEFKLDSSWVEGLRSGALGYARLVNILDRILGQNVKKTVSSGFWSTTTTTTITRQMKDVSTVNKILSQMVLSAGILYQNRKLFSFKVDPDYMKGVASNVMDYALLARSLALNDKSTSYDIFSESMGWDPISRAASGMVKIASAYDKLASAIKGFSGALNGLDGRKVNMFRYLTGNLALLSAMDSNMFSNMLKVLESRSGVFANLLRDQARAEGIGGKRVKGDFAPPGAVIQTTKASVGRDGGEGARDSRGETQLQKLDKIVLLLSNINNVAGSGGTLDTYLMSKQTDTGAPSDIGKVNV